jgi:hypothetical protein
VRAISVGVFCRLAPSTRWEEQQGAHHAIEYPGLPPVADHLAKANDQRAWQQRHEDRQHRIGQRRRVLQGMRRVGVEEAAAIRSAGRRAVGSSRHAGPGAIRPARRQYVEGKEVRFGTAGSARFAAGTTSFTTGSVDAMHDSFTPLGAVPAFIGMMLQCIFGGKGVGFLAILVYGLIAVFSAGLTVGAVD